MNGSGNGGPATASRLRKKKRPKTDPSAKLIARGKEENARRMKAVWLSVAQNRKAPPMARVVAAEKWLDREFGKPVQKNENEDTVKIVVSREERQKRIKTLVAKISPPEPDDRATH